MSISSEVPNTPDMKRARKRILSSEEMHRILFDAITEHKLLPGTKLREEDLAEAFGVGRTRIRELLQGLSHLGVVRLHPHRSASVAKPTEAEARQVFQARIILETGIITQVIKQITQSDILCLQKTLNQERDAVNNGDRGAAIRYSGEFHIQLCEIIGNEMLTDMLRGLVSRTSLILAVFPPSGVSSCDSANHSALLQEIQARNIEEGIKALVNDLRAAESSLSFVHDEGGAPDLRQLISEYRTRVS